MGHLWRDREVSVAVEHYCSNATEQVMSQLYPYFDAKEKNGLTVVALSVGDELHEIGIRMIGDFLEMEGWRVYHVGINLLHEDILKALNTTRADLLAVSTTMNFNLNSVADLIRAVLSEDVTKHVKILVGGQAFRRDKNLWIKVGADGYASDENEAAEAAESLVSSGPTKGI